MAKILFVDDDASMRAAMRIILTSQGYEYVGAEDGIQGLGLFATERPDLAILDVMTPGLNGFEACERIRAQAPGLPVLFLSAKGEVEDKKTGLRSGADDYMVKPFDAEELLLRVAALLRRAGVGGADTVPSAAEAGIVTVGDLVVNFRRHEVERGGEKLALTPKEFQILAYLAERAGEVVSQRELVEELWGSDYVGEPTSVAVYVRHIREKIERDPSRPAYLQTVWGVGYCLHEGE